MGYGPKFLRLEPTMLLALTFWGPTHSTNTSTRMTNMKGITKKENKVVLKSLKIVSLLNDSITHILFKKE